jgi:hypothetical protein
MRFPKPWRVQNCGDCYRVFDANNRHLFIITGDEFLDERERPEDATVFEHGSAEERQALAEAIEGIEGEEAAADG